jgi:hypothetical protein
MCMGAPADLVLGPPPLCLLQLPCESFTVVCGTLKLTVNAGEGKMVRPIWIDSATVCVDT